MIPGYEIRELPFAELKVLWEGPHKQIFDDQTFSWFPDPPTSDAKERFEGLRDRLKGQFELCLGVFHDGKFVGWSYGAQYSPYAFFMVSSAILPEHRRKGIYSELMDRAVKRARVEGFNTVLSRHSCVNSAIIIPKLKYGFHITGFEMSVHWGALVQLTYHLDPLREKVFQHRSGFIRPDDEIRRELKL